MDHLGRQAFMDRRRRPEGDGGIDVVDARLAAREVGSGMPGSMQTRSPGFRFVTSEPVSITVPAASWPSTIGALTMKWPILPWV